jgi:hypothetical protein
VRRRPATAPFPELPDAERTYDRPVDDILMVQDDIAGEVTKALTASIEAMNGLACSVREARPFVLLA